MEEKRILGHVCVCVWQQHKSTDGDDSFDVRFSGVLNDGFQTRDLIFNFQYLFQLFAVLDHNYVGLTIEGAVQTSFGRVRRVNPRSKSTTDVKPKILKIDK